ncbi:MAG: hypothetical protein LRY66_13295 [Saccharospirillaceae bacterium]|nr:hypothetical protein [Saccharospirillaceae bacterium]MCD8532287.1 hypothetical protein [Saccharospirillaceae bacterium]
MSGTDIAVLAAVPVAVCVTGVAARPIPLTVITQSANTVPADYRILANVVFVI